MKLLDNIKFNNYALFSYQNMSQEDKCKSLTNIIHQNAALTLDMKLNIHEKLLLLAQN